MNQTGDGSLFDHIGQQIRRTVPFIVLHISLATCVEEINLLNNRRACILAYDPFHAILEEQLIQVRSVDIRFKSCQLLFAQQAGSGQAANMVALGTVMRYQDVIVPDDIKGLLKEKYTGKKAAFIPANEKALDLGFAQ